MQAKNAETGEGGAEALLLDAALESIPYGFCVWSGAFELVMWNEHYCHIYNFPLERMRKGMSLLEICVMSGEKGNHPDQSPEQFFESYTSELLANRGGAQAKSQETLSGGRIIETAHVFSPGLGWVITHEDVTEEIARTEMLEQRRAELEQQNLRLDAAVNNISQGLSMYDAQGRLVICNAPYARIYDLPAEFLIPGTTLEEILGRLFDRGMRSGADREGYIKWRREVIESGAQGKNIHEFNGRIILMQHHPMKDGGWVSTHEDITEQRQTEARIHHLARHDSLTELPNRVLFLEEMARAESLIKRGEKAAILWIDLDHFKAVNDTLGHSIGDSVLSAVSERIQRLIRDTDMLARLGADEFAVLLHPIDDPRAAAITADRIIKAVAEPFIIEGNSIQIGASIGIAVAPGDGLTTDMLLKNADMALHRAKNEGRFTYHFFEAGMDAALQNRRLIEAGLRQALARNEFRLVFQPLLGLKDNRITCFEALLRWDHAERGTISPVDFIPVAEETGLILPIGEWVLREACTIAATWPAHVRVAVNLSPVQFKNQNLADLVQSVLDESRLPATRLELEITESLLLADSEATLSILHALRAKGIRISMDDFGTGYSSLSYLRSFPFDKIKIDRSFMRDLDSQSDSLAIIKAVIGLGQSLGMATTAEGVETHEQLDAVRAQGCSEVQGFLFSPPVDPSSIAGLLADEGAAAIRMRKAS